jgi:hypothetical protein
VETGGPQNANPRFGLKSPGNGIDCAATSSFRHANVTVSVKSDPRDLVRILLLAYVPAGALLGGVALVSQVFGINAGNFTRDPANILKFPWYLGALSHAGVLLWCSTVAVCLLTAAATRDEDVPSRLRPFLLWAGLLSGVLLVDDLFLFHEVIGPRILDVPERYVYAGYGIATLALMATFRATILRETDYLVLGVGGAFLGLSQVADTLTNQAADTSAKFLVEDGLKFLGIVGWFTYFARVCLKSLRARSLPASREATRAEYRAR